MNVHNVLQTRDPVKIYLKEMGSISLLTRKNEVDIAKRVEKLVKA